MTSSTCSGSCGVGYYSSSGATECTICAVGTYTSATASSICTDCGAGLILIFWLFYFIEKDIMEKQQDFQKVLVQENVQQVF